MVSIDTWLNENLLLILNFCFTVFILRWKVNFFIIKLIVSFPDDIKLFSDQIKRFNESVIDPKCLLNWKLQRHPFVLIKIYTFQATLYLLVYYYFYLRSMVYMLSKMVWNYNQHYGSEITAIWLIYSDLPTSFVVT